LKQNDHYKNKEEEKETVKNTAREVALLQDGPMQMQFVLKKQYN
jgi:hypothetical protein